MKRNRLTLLALTSLLAMGAVAPSAFAAPPDRDWDRDHRDGRHDGRHDGRRDGRDDRRDDRRHYSTGYREGYHDARRADRGYYRPGPPPPPHVWARGQRYHDYYRGPVYVVNDYPYYHLRRPPRGYHWVRDDTGNFLMVAIASGIIADLVLHH